MHLADNTVLNLLAFAPAQRRSQQASSGPNTEPATSAAGNPNAGPANLGPALAAPRLDPADLQTQALAAKAMGNAQAFAAGGPMQSRPGALDRLKAKLKVAVEKHDTARRLGVNVAKANFVNRLLGAAVSGIFFGVAVALTVATGGLAAPMLALAGVRFAVATADAVCAYQVLRAAQHQQDPINYPPRSAPPMGGNSLANLAHWGLSKLWPDQPERVKKVATLAAAGMSLALTAIGLATIMVGPPPDAVGRIARFVGTSVGSALYLADHATNDQHLLAERERLQALDDLFKVLEEGHAEELAAFENLLRDKGAIQDIGKMLDPNGNMPVDGYLLKCAGDLQWDKHLQAPQGKTSLTEAEQRLAEKASAERLHATIVDVLNNPALGATALRDPLLRYKDRIAAGDDSRKNADTNLPVRVATRELTGLLSVSLLIKGIIGLAQQ